MTVPCPLPSSTGRRILWIRWPELYAHALLECCDGPVPALQKPNLWPWRYFRCAVGEKLVPDAQRLWLRTGAGSQGAAAREAHGRVDATTVFLYGSFAAVFLFTLHVLTN